MANFIRVRGGEDGEVKRDLLINADGVLEVRKAASRILVILYDTAMDNTGTASVAVHWSLAGGYTVTDEDAQKFRLAIEESCKNPGAIPYVEGFAGETATLARYVVASKANKMT